jgi:hypothetical protein
MKKFYSNSANAFREKTPRYPLKDEGFWRVKGANGVGPHKDF